MRWWLIGIALALAEAVSGVPVGQAREARSGDPAVAAGLVEFSIPRLPISEALLQHSIQSGLNISGLTRDFESRMSNPVYGSMEPLKALDQLLRGSGLSYRLIGERSVSVIVDVSTPRRSNTLVRSSRGVLEEVVVTASKRANDLQKTSIAITHLGQDEITLGRIEDLRDIGSIVPGLELVTTGPQESVLVQLRGVGTTNITEIADGPVAVHIDGIYSPRSQGVAALLHDINRLEVLRGPQGTLFGRNSSSGSVNVYHNAPMLGERSAEIEIGFGNYSQQRLAGVFNIPLSESLAVRISGVTQEHDPYTEVIDNYAGLGPHYPESVNALEPFDQSLALGQAGLDAEDRYSLRVSALWNPQPQLDVQLSYERYQDDGTGNAELDPSLVERGIRAVVLDTRPFIDLQNDSLRGRVEYRFDNGLTATYLVGAARMQREQLYDTDQGRTRDFEIERTADSEFDFYSHELHVRNSDADRLQWIAGVFASRESNNIVFAVDQQNRGGARVINNTPSWISGLPGAGVSYAVQPERRSESLGIYSQLSYGLSDHSRLTIGARYNSDTKSDRGGRAINCRGSSSFGPYFDPANLGAGAPASGQIFIDPNAQQAINSGQFFDGGSNLGIADQPCWVRQVNDIRERWNNTSGLLKYDISLTPDILLYGSIASGFKAGHIQDAGNTAAPETVVSYEIGAKSQFFGDTLRLNAALYQADYKDLQFSDDDRIDVNGDGVPDSGGSTVVRNASNATVRGLEAEMHWLISEVDFLQASLTLLDAEFGSFDIPDPIFGNLFNPFSNPGSNSTMDDVDLSGNSPPRAPDWKLALSYQRDFELKSGVITLGAKAVFSDDYYLDIYNRDSLPAGVFASVPNGGSGLGQQRSYAWYDLNLRYRNNRRNWLVDAYINNAGDEAVKISSSNFLTPAGFTANYLPPRTYGVRFRMAF